MIPVPSEVSGRPVTPRGVHLVPFGFHDAWLPRADYWIDLLLSMHLSWVLVISEGDAVTKPQPAVGGRSVVQLFLDNGIIPIVRFGGFFLPAPFPHIYHVEVLVNQFAAYDVQPVVQLANEPGDPREWRDGEVPEDWFEWFVGDWFPRTASDVIRAGAVAGFPDGPCYPRDPFPLMASIWPQWEVGNVAYLGHHYGLNRPADYPYDSVTQTGNPKLTEQDLRDALGVFYDDPGYNDVSLARMNEARDTWKQPGLTAVGDDTCWRGWERVQHWMQTHFNKTLLMAMTEGGWTPGARAGSGPGADIRWPKPTPDTVAALTLEAFEAETPMFAQCPWLLASDEMGGVGWPDDCWVGTSFYNLYGMEKPVVQALRDHPPTPEPPQPPGPDLDAAILSLADAGIYTSKMIYHLERARGDGE